MVLGDCRGKRSLEKEPRGATTREEAFYTMRSQLGRTFHDRRGFRSNRLRGPERMHAPAAQLPFFPRTLYFRSRIGRRAARALRQLLPAGLERNGEKRAIRQREREREKHKVKEKRCAELLPVRRYTHGSKEMRFGVTGEEDKKKRRYFRNSSAVAETHPGPARRPGARVRKSTGKKNKGGVFSVSLPRPSLTPSHPFL